jgi:hypothetical protein
MRLPKSLIFCGIAGTLLSIWLSLLPCTIAARRGSPRATAIGLLGGVGALLLGFVGAGLGLSFVAGGWLLGRSHLFLFLGFWFLFFEFCGEIPALIWAFCEPIKPTKRNWVGWAWCFLPVCMIPLWVVGVVFVFTTAINVNQTDQREQQRIAIEQQRQQGNARQARVALQQQLAEKEREQKKPFVPNLKQENNDLAEALAKDREAGIKARNEQQERDAEQDAQLKEQKKEQEQKNWRNWTINGKVVKAKFVKYIAGVTFLETESGEAIRVDISSLGSADKQWIESKWKK